MKPLTLIALACLAGTAVSAPLAADRHPAAPAIENIVVTASRGAEALTDTLAPVTVITRDDIERLQSQDLPDLLIGLPGVNFASNGGPGKSGSLFLRGTESDHVMVLIDGIKVGSATSGSTPLEQIPADQIERIEIVRGPRSSLYGSEAIGGVIQIFTRRGSRKDQTPSFAMGGGSRGDGRMEAGLRGGSGNTWYSLSASGRTTEGVDVRPSLGEPDRDGYRNLTGSLRAGHTFENGAEVSASLLHAEGDNDYDGSSQNESETRNQVIGLSASLDPSARWHSRVSAGHSLDESDNFLDGVFVSQFDTQRDTLSWQNDVQMHPEHKLRVGLDYQNDRVDSTTAYAETERDNVGVFAVYQGSRGAHDLQLSLREDDNQQFGRNATGGASYGYRFANGLRAVATYGTAFKAPTFNELYFPNFGSPDLDPEEARHVEVSLAASTAGYAWALNAFQTRVDDLIAFDADLEAPANIDRARIEGLEAQLGTTWQDLKLQTYLTWLRPENDAGGANDGNTLPRRRQRSARLDADYAHRRFSAGLSLFGASRGYDNIANTTRLPGYATLNLRLGWQVLPQWLLQLEGRNVLDKHYETAATYATYGASVMATVRFTPSRS